MDNAVGPDSGRWLDETLEVSGTNRFRHYGEEKAPTLSQQCAKCYPRDSWISLMMVNHCSDISDQPYG